jgi:hypothetical protein
MSFTDNSLKDGLMADQGRHNLWEPDPEERPVPLVADEAESIVRAAHDAIGRENTDPSILIPAPRKPASKVFDRHVGRFAVALLAVSCAVTFSVGWLDGSAAAAQVHLEEERP